MRRALLILPIVLLLISSGASAGTDYGAGVTLRKTSSVADIVAKPDRYSGKTVTVTGRVVDVCPNRGCWIDLAGDKPGQTIRAKVEDGVIVFPPSARGKQATVQGVVETMPMCPEEAVLFRRQEARRKGVPYDPASVTGKESSLAIRATGAVIE